MNDEEMRLLNSLIGEYEIRARYNSDPREYKTYSMLLKVKEIVSKPSPKEESEK